MKSSTNWDEKKFKTYQSPYGTINILSKGEKIQKVSLGPFEKKRIPKHKDRNLIFRAFNAYFEDKTDVYLKKIPLNMSFLSPFSQKVLLFLKRNVPFGKLITYKELAEELNSSPRAIGGIMAKNPFPIFIPCHRVISIRGLGGYSSDILWKIALLKLEGIKREVLI